MAAARSRQGTASRRANAGSKSYSSSPLAVALRWLRYSLSSTVSARPGLVLGQAGRHDRVRARELRAAPAQSFQHHNLGAVVGVSLAFDRRFGGHGHP